MPNTDDYHDDTPDNRRQSERRKRDDYEDRARYATVERVKEMIDNYAPKIARAEIITTLQSIGLNLATFESTTIARGAIEWALDSVTTQNLRKKERYKAILLGVVSLIAAATLPFILWILAQYKKS